MIVEINGNKYPVQIERKKNKNTYLRVKEDGTIFVTTGYFVRDEAIYKLIEKNKPVLLKMILKAESRKKRKEKFYYLGTSYDVIYITGFDGVEFQKDKIYVKDEKTLKKFLLQETKKMFENHYERYYGKFEEKIPKYPLRIRSMKTRWGVCNRRSKTVTLNSRLIEYPIECLDYVIVHELSHLLHFDHSKSFWDTVSYYYPNYKQAKRILKD